MFYDQNSRIAIVRQTQLRNPKQPTVFVCSNTIPPKAVYYDVVMAINPSHKSLEQYTAQRLPGASLHVALTKLEVCERFPLHLLQVGQSSVDHDTIVCLLSRQLNMWKQAIASVYVNVTHVYNSEYNATVWHGRRTALINVDAPHSLWVPAQIPDYYTQVGELSAYTVVNLSYIAAERFRNCVTRENAAYRNPFVMHLFNPVQNCNDYLYTRRFLPTLEIDHFGARIGVPEQHMPGAVIKSMMWWRKQDQVAYVYIPHQLDKLTHEMTQLYYGQSCHITQVGELMRSLANQLGRVCPPQPVRDMWAMADYEVAYEFPPNLAFTDVEQELYFLKHIKSTRVLGWMMYEKYQLQTRRPVCNVQRNILAYVSVVRPPLNLDRALALRQYEYVRQLCLHWVMTRMPVPAYVASTDLHSIVKRNHVFHSELKYFIDYMRHNPGTAVALVDEKRDFLASFGVNKKRLP